MVEFAIDGGSVSAHLALPDGGAAGPGLIVLHPWWGLNEEMKSFADRLAGEGFVVLAPDLYHGTVVSTIEEATSQSDALDPGQAVREVGGAVATAAATLPGGWRALREDRALEKSLLRPSRRDGRGEWPSLSVQFP